MTLSRFEQDRRAAFRQRDVTLERLQRERDELLAREKAARAEAETAQRRLSELSSMSRTFASSMRGVSVERQRARRRLAVQHAVGCVLAEADGLEDAAAGILEAVGEGFGWDLGALWTVDEGAGVLRCCEVWRPPAPSPSGETNSHQDGFESVSRRANLPRGSGLPGRVWVRGEAIWIEDVLKDEDFLRREAAAGEGLRKAFAFPIRDGGRTRGVVEFFGRNVAPPDEDLLRAAALIGGQIGQFAERRRAERERDQLLARERAARAEADAARREVTGILESITDAFAAFDHDWRYAYINKAACEMIRATGREPENLLGQVLWECTPEFVGTKLQTELLRAAREGAVVEFEEFYTPFDAWFHVRVYPSEGGVSVYFEDVTERKRAEQERERLRHEAESGRARLEAILQQMPGGVFIADRSGQITLANEGAVHIYRKRLQWVEECGRHTLSYPEGRSLSPEEYPLNRALGGESVSNLEHYVLRDDGTRGIVSLNAAPVRDQEGHIVAAVTAFQDVTALKEAREALEESEERLRTVVSNAPVVLFSLDREGIVTLSTGRGLEVLGLKPNEDVGKSAFELYADNPPILDDVRRALAGEVFIEYREVSGLIFEIGYAPIRDRSGEVVGVTGVATDVTERRKAEEERERFLAREWRARAEAEERKRISRELHDRVAHSMGVVHQSLELYEVFKEGKPSQAEAKMKLARETTREALDLTRNISRELHNSEAGDGLSSALSNLLKTTVPPGLESSISVEGDESLIPPRVREQLFLILREAVRNVVSHSEAGRLEIEVKVSPERVVGCVEDDGRGFEGPSEDGDGAPGRGLHSMRERAELVGGALRLSSTPGAGTQIVASVPLNAVRGGQDMTEGADE